MSINMTGTSITINGLRIEVQGSHIYVSGRLYGPVDGGPVPDAGNRTLTLDRDGSVGDVGGDLTVHGDNVTLIVRGSVQGSVQSNGPVQVKDVYGSVNAGGDVAAKNVYGSVNTAGKFSR